MDTVSAPPEEDIFHTHRMEGKGILYEYLTMSILCMCDWALKSHSMSHPLLPAPPSIGSALQKKKKKQFQGEQS